MLRRVPRQGRAVRRVARLLDAAEAVIGEAGVHGASTNAIAARAETAVGSLYRFFPDKHALVRALAMRYRAEIGRRMAVLLAPPPGGASEPPAGALAGAVVDALASFCDAHPAYRHVVAAGAGTGGPDAALRADVVARLDALIARRLPRVAPGRRAAAVVLVEAVHGVLFYATGRPAGERTACLGELTRTVAAAFEALARCPVGAREGPDVGGPPRV